MDSKDYFLGDHPEALDFVLLYVRYINSVDDLIDEEITDKAESILDVLVLHRQVMSHPFWRVHHDRLLLIDVLIENAYRDSERLKPTMPVQARVWASYGELMIFTVIALTRGEEFLRKISTVMRAENCTKQMEGDK